MNRVSRSILATVVAVTMPMMSLAQDHHQNGGGGSSSSSGSHTSSPPAHASAPAAPSYSAPSHAAPPAQGGFNFSHDTAPAAPPVQRTAPVTAHYTAPTTHYTAPTTTAPSNQGTHTIHTMPVHRVASFTSNTYGPYNGQFHGNHLHNAHYNGNAWGWNHGEQWYPAQSYWGGGFWGDLAIASLVSLIAYGTYYDAQNQYYYPSYEVLPDSPGAEVLQDYGLTQTQCGPPNLVVIWGPDNSVICTYPNDTVSPGNYQLDPTTLTLVSQQ